MLKLKCEFPQLCLCLCVINNLILFIFPRFKWHVSKAVVFKNIFYLKIQILPFRAKPRILHAYFLEFIYRPWSYTGITISRIFTLSSISLDKNTIIISILFWWQYKLTEDLSVVSEMPCHYAKAMFLYFST